MRMKKHAIEAHHQNQNGIERMVQVVKNRTVFLIELFNTPEEHWCYTLEDHWCYTLTLIVASYNRIGNATLN